MKTITTLFLLLISSLLWAGGTEKEMWDCYFITKNDNQKRWIWDHSNPRIPKKESMTLSKFSFNIQKGEIKEDIPLRILWKKEAAQVISEYYFQSERAFFFSTRSDTSPAVENTPDLFHFFDIDNPLKIYTVSGWSFREVVKRKNNNLQLVTVLYGDSACLTTYTTPLLKPIIEKDFSLWRDNGMFSYMNLDSSYRLRFAGVGLKNMTSDFFIPTEILLKNNITDTNFFLQYQDQNMVILTPVKDRREQLIFSYQKKIKKWDVYRINMKFSDGKIIGEKYIIYDLYDIDGNELTSNINVIDLISGDIQSLYLPLNTKIIAIQGNLWILTMPGRLMFLRKTGKTFQKVGTLLREDAEKITFAWIRKKT